MDKYPERLVGEFISSVVTNEWTNKEYKHLVLRVHERALSAYAGQMFHLLCPSPDGSDVWMRRPMSIYKIDRLGGHIEFLYKVEGRGTRGMATLKAGDDFNIAGPLWSRVHFETGMEAYRRARPRRRPPATLAPLSQLAARE